MVSSLPSALWHCWLGIMKSIRRVKNSNDEVLVWLSVWSEVQMICIWFSWCHFHPIISCFINIQDGLPFWCQLTQFILEKRPLNGNYYYYYFYYGPIQQISRLSVPAFYCTLNISCCVLLHKVSVRYHPHTDLSISDSDHPTPVTSAPSFNSPLSSITLSLFHPRLKTYNVFFFRNPSHCTFISCSSADSTDFWLFTVSSKHICFFCC